MNQGTRYLTPKFNMAREGEYYRIAAVGLNGRRDRPGLIVDNSEIQKSMDQMLRSYNTSSKQSIKQNVDMNNKDYSKPSTGRVRSSEMVVPEQSMAAMSEAQSDPFGGGALVVRKPRGRPPKSRVSSIKMIKPPKTSSRKTISKFAR